LLNVSADKAASARDQVARDSGVWLSDRFWDYEYPNTCAMEFVVGEKALALENKIFTKAMTLFDKALNP
jgi:hypothetical protein